MNVLVVDDEPAICWGLESLLVRQGYRVQTVGSAEKGLEVARQNAFELVLLDVRLPGLIGIASLDQFQKVTYQAPIIIMSAFGDLETAVEVVKRGACDYLHKPFGIDEVVAVCKKALRLRSSNGSKLIPLYPSFTHCESLHPAAVSMLIGNSPVMQRVFRQIALVADSELSVLITGETGTGKELVAAAIHHYSSRREEAYVPIAPVTFSSALLESELFGHVRGAFTGATDDRAGLFETASGGTVLLDEIGDLPLSMQVKLLRVLEQRQYCRVGEIRSRPCNVRVLSASHQSLQKSVSEGSFRQDLLYRLSASEVHLPPLRDRPEDIQPLVVHFLRLTGYPNSQESISPEVIAQLQHHSWPGNVRELRNAVERAAVVARGRPLDISDFPQPHSPAGNINAANKAAESVLMWARETLCQAAPSETRKPNGETMGADCLYERFLNTVEPPMFRAVLESVDGNRSAAAEVLGMHRATLRQRLRRYGME